jgi:futalosine hydrolase
MSQECAGAIDIAVLGAVRQEIQPLVNVLNAPRSFDFRGEVLHIGTCQDRSVLIGTTGLGKVNAAVTTAAIMETFGATEVWNIGCAGAYEEGPLRVGDVLISDNVLCGDEGILSKKGIHSLQEIGFPLVVKDGQPFYDHFPLARDSLGFERILDLTPPGVYRTDQGRLLRALHPEEISTLVSEKGAEIFRIVRGASLTVSLVSGDGKTARKRHERYGAMAENMEGSAIAQTCFRYEIPFLECRGISNMAGDRDKTHWQLELAASRTCMVVRHWLEGIGREVDRP